MKKNASYFFLFAIAAALLSACSGNNVPPLKETYSRTDKNPFGAYVAFREVNELFYRNDVRVKKEGIEKSLPDTYNDTAALFISICKNFYLRKKELSSLLEFAEKGNSVFVSASRFDTSLLQQLGLGSSKDGFSSGVSFFYMKYTGVHLIPPYYGDSTAYGYYYMPLDNSFTVFDEEDTRVLGTNEYGEPNFVVVFYGKGRLYLHCEPRVFGNYFLLQKENYKYLQRTFSFMPAVPSAVFWDDYYNKRNLPPAPGNDKESESVSGLSVLLKFPATAWAFWVSLLLLLLYILFGGKRRQRIIKPIAPNKNTSVAFTETVALLYLQKKDHRNIAEKMATYFLEHVRSQYFISTHNLNEEFTGALSRKSNVPLNEVEELVSMIKQVQRYDDVGGDFLMRLNNKIENFYKYKR